MRKLLHFCTEIKSLLYFLCLKFHHKWWGVKPHTKISGEILVHNNPRNYWPMLKKRNSRTGNDEDYFLSCVSDSNGEFFDSRKAKEHEPKNADADGAYNIGVKGLMAVNEILKSKGEKKPSLKISKEQFFNFAVFNQGASEK